MKFIISDKNKFQVFSTLFRHLPTFTETINLHVTDEGIYAQGMDSSQISLFEINLAKEWFDEFVCEKNCVIGLMCSIFFKVFQCIDSLEQKMTFNYTDDKDFLDITLEGDNVKKEFQISLLDIDMEMLNIPETEYDVDIEIKSLDISNYINQMLIFDETFSLRCTQEEIIMKSNSESGSMSIILSDDSIIEYAIEEELDLTQNFSLNYIKKMCAFSKMTRHTFINMKRDTPMRFHQSLDDKKCEESNNYIRFYLAPKLDEE
jgi:proliferating cell nuclear antigen